MSSGRTHSRAALAMMVPLTGFAFLLYAGGQVEAANGIMIGQVCGWIVTPDADVDGLTHEEMRWFQINPILGHAFHLFWYPYSKMFRHRGISHVFVLGTLTRIVYISILLSLIQFAFNQKILVKDLFISHLINDYPNFCKGLVFAWSIQDLIHSIFDICSSWLKRRRLLWYAHL